MISFGTLQRYFKPVAGEEITTLADADKIVIGQSPSWARKFISGANVKGLFAASTHASRHSSTGADPVTPAAIGAEATGTAVLLAGTQSVAGAKTFTDLLTVTKVPTGTIPALSTLVVNPASARADALLAWLGVGDALRASIDEDGDGYLASSLGINCLTPPTRLTVADTVTISPRGIMSWQVSNSVDGARLHLRKDRGVAVGTPAIVQTGDMLGRVVASGWDGANYLEAAGIDFGVSGTVGTGRVPTRLGFLTATDASPSVLTERACILPNGYMGINHLAPTYRLMVGGSTVADMVASQMGFDMLPVANPTAPSGIPVLGSGVNAGAHAYGVTYTTALGESALSSASATVTTDGTNGKVVLTIPTSTDPRVTGRRIYRTKLASINDFFLLASIANNVDTSYDDTTPDTSLTGGGRAQYRPNTTIRYLASLGVKVLHADSNCTLLGTMAGLSITEAMEPTFIGKQAGYSCTSGAANTFVGAICGYNTGTGSWNTAIGRGSLFSNSTGNGNCAFGYNALTSGYAIGSTIAIGMNAGRSLTSGSGNVFVGDGAGYDATQKVDTSNSIALGQNVYTTKNAQVILGNANIVETLLRGKVGVGLVDPSAILHLKAGTATAGTAPLKLTTGVVNTTAELGTVEFSDPDIFFSVTDSTVKRKAFVLDDGTRLTSGKIPRASTNGRLIDGPTPLAGTKVYYVADTSGGAVTRKLTVIDGILTAET